MRDIPGNRVLAADPGGGRMSGPMGGGHGRPGGGGPGGFGGPGGPRRGPMGRGGMGPMGGAMMPAEKAKNFRATFRRLIGELRPERKWIGLVALVALFSTAGQVFGPKILGNGINKLMDGLVGKLMPAGPTHDQMVAGLRAAHDPRAGLFSSE